MTKISPSILSADFSNLRAEIEKVSDYAQMLHIDVMDGHFVPNISMGVPVLQSIRKITDMFLDVHLMISRPQDYVDAFIKAGADLICFHLESDCDAKEVIEKVHSAGKKVAIAIKPNTPVEDVLPYVEYLDMVLVMTVEPGFGGQTFIEETMPKVKVLREYIDKINKDIDLQVDGGINRQTAIIAIKNGANVLVAGSSVFNSKNPDLEVKYLRDL